ncbi:MAG TPA: hypothetical protein VMO26_27250 [Vicinamibacterales bacterium]|nr:hypothetical protein [Vicinamibacterales bacterium]
MTAFEFLSVALSFVLGLAVTLVLTSLLTAFRARRHARLHWLPFLWAGYVLVYQFQYWWAIFALSSAASWSVAAFGLLLLLAAILFMAGGLVLPIGSTAYPDDLYAYFDDDGKWCVVAIAAYNLVGMFANVALFDLPVLSILHALLVAEVGLAAVVVSSRRRPAQTFASIAFGVLLAGNLVLATPPSY